MWGDTNDSAEYQEVTAKQIPFYNLKAGKLYRTFNPLKLVRLPFGFLQAFYYLLRIKPDLVVSFGGYLSVPVVFDAWLLGIPIITHEQTVISGFANKFVARLALKVLVSWPQSLRIFPWEKAALVGLPLRQFIIDLSLSTLPQSSRQPLLYFTGGKQGSHALNEVLYKSLPQLLEKYKVVHQCGQNSVYGDYKRLQELRKTLPVPLADNYRVADYFNSEALQSIYREAALVIGRSGAHSIYELLALGKPCLLIPFPKASHNEQYLNAKILADAGIARILEQKDLSPESLAANIDSIIAHLPEFIDNGSRAKTLIIYDAAQKIAAAIIAILKTSEV